METEQELYVLMKAVKEQQAAVERAMQGMEKQRGELYEAITQLNKLRANVAAEAMQGVQKGVSNMGVEVNASLNTEVDKAKKTLSDMTEDLRSSSTWLTWRWTLGLVVLGIIIGFAACWAMLGKDVRATRDRLDLIEQTLQQTQQAPPPAAKTKPHSSSGNRP